MGSSKTPPRANVGIIGLGEMGAAIAQLLIAEGYRVFSRLEGRSETTKARAKAAGVESEVESDETLVSYCDYIVSIVPPADAVATAERIAKASTTDRSSSPFVYLELNAVAPSTARTIEKAFAPVAANVHFIDGGIIGGPPKLSPAQNGEGEAKWSSPSIVLSGPYKLAQAKVDGENLAKVLNTRDVGDEIGAASGLKCCFASLTKGYAALAIQSFTTASRLGVLDHLQEQIAQFPGGAQRLEQTRKSLASMPPKAGRWVEEMNQINQTFLEDGGWGTVDRPTDVFKQIAGVYDFVSNGTELGKEHVTDRQRGKTAEDAVDVIREALEGRSSKLDK